MKKIPDSELEQVPSVAVDLPGGHLLVSICKTDRLDRPTAEAVIIALGYVVEAIKQNGLPTRFTKLLCSDSEAEAIPKRVSFKVVENKHEN